MKATAKALLQGACLTAILALGGCVYRVHGPAVEVSAEPVPAPYPAGYYEPVYYDAGWYSGPYWYWYGPDHRLFHEARDWHERRYYSYHHRHWR